MFTSLCDAVQVGVIGWFTTQILLWLEYPALQDVTWQDRHILLVRVCIPWPFATVQGFVLSTHTLFSKCCDEVQVGAIGFVVLFPFVGWFVIGCCSVEGDWFVPEITVVLLITVVFAVLFVVV